MNGANCSKTRRPPVAGALAAAGFALSAFILIGATVSTRLAEPFDAWLLLAMRSAADPSRPFGPAWLQETGRDFTALGSNSVLSLLVLAGSGVLLLARRRAAAMFLFGSFAGALALESVIKHWLARPRPEIVPHAARVFTASFPSGHATVSAAVACALAFLLPHLTPDRRLWVFAAAVAACLAFVVGASRIYLGVHWPTDVAAGWALGAGWACFCRATFLRWASRAQLGPVTAIERTEH